MNRILLYLDHPHTRAAHQIQEAKKEMDRIASIVGDDWLDYHVPTVASLIDRQKEFSVAVAASVDGQFVEVETIAVDLAAMMRRFAVQLTAAADRLDRGEVYDAE